VALQSKVVTDALVSSFDAQGFGVNIDFTSGVDLYMDIYGAAGANGYTDQKSDYSGNAFFTQYQYYAPGVTFTASVGPVFNFIMLLFGTSFELRHSICDIKPLIACLIEESTYNGYLNLQTPEMTFKWDGE
jgi:hypothetical protein